MDEFAEDPVRNLVNKKLKFMLISFSCLHQAYETRASGVVPDTQNKQLTVMEKIVKDTHKIIDREREAMESKSASKNDMEKTFSIDDTNALLAAINHGKGLKTVAGPGPGGPGPMVNRNSPVPGPNVSMGSQQINKAPSTIKTNIKAANQVHPYQR